MKIGKMEYHWQENFATILLLLDGMKYKCTKLYNDFLCVSLLHVYGHTLSRMMSFPTNDGIFFRINCEMAHNINGDDLITNEGSAHNAYVQLL